MNDFSEKSFLISLLDEFTKLQSLKLEQPMLCKLATQYRDHLIKSDLAEQLDRYRRRESELKVSLLQSIKSDRWDESARLSAEISNVTQQKAQLAAKLSEVNS